MLYINGILIERALWFHIAVLFNIEFKQLYFFRYNFISYTFTETFENLLRRKNGRLTLSSNKNETEGVWVNRNLGLGLEAAASNSLK